MQTAESVTYGLWALWLMSWTIAMFWSGRTTKKDRLGAELVFRALFYFGLISLFALPGRNRFWYPGKFASWSLVALVAFGLSFTWWARIQLGRLWSDRVVTKEGHQVIDTGPYRIVRHPIYSGLLLAAFATAIEKATPLALLGAAVVTVAFIVKAKREEHFLRAELGASAYDGYARNTAMLVPFVRRSRHLEVRS